MNKTEEFARALLLMLKQEASEWVALVETTPEEKITDPYFRAVSRLYHSLDESQRHTFLALVQQKSVEGAGSILAVIDGCSVMDNWLGDFRLTFEGEDLTWGLLDSFIGADEADEPTAS